MTDSSPSGPAPRRLRSGIVLRVAEQSCEVRAGGEVSVVGYLSAFPSPRTERVSPGHLVALAARTDGTEVVVWRWYDAVVVGTGADGVRLWEPAHGEVAASSRGTAERRPLGTRAYLSAGLPGSDWWVAGPVVARAEDAEVELADVEHFCSEHDLWSLLEPRVVEGPAA